MPAPTHITSRDNALLRHARAVRDGKINNSIFIEGLRLCEEALLSKLKIEAIIFSEELARKDRAAIAIANLMEAADRAASVSEKLLESVSYTKTPQGIIVIAERPDGSERNFATKTKADSLLVLLHQVNNPVNVGAILRTAEAAGVAGVITTEHTSDPLSPKSLRGAMGSAFRVPLWIGAGFEEAIRWSRNKGLVTLCADASAKLAYTSVDWSRGSVLLLGPESDGFSAEEIRLADEAISIPMIGPVESLNVSVAAGIVLFEAARQRKE
jgi:RNA methyltransferase, TrmH family